MAHANVLGHLETGDLVVFAVGDWDVAVVHAKNPALLLRDSRFSESVVSPRSLVASKSDSGSIGTVVDAREFGQGAPSAADVQESLALLEINLFADDSKLVILELFERLLRRAVGDDPGSVNHAWAQEPSVEVVTSVVVVTYLLFIYRSSISGNRALRGDGEPTLGSGVHNDLGRKDEEDVLEQGPSESEAGPVMSILHHLQAVPIELDIPIEVHGVERLHGDLVLPAVLGLVGFVLEGEVVLDWTAWELDLFILARTEGRSQVPVADQDRDGGEESKEHGGLQSAADLP